MGGLRSRLPAAVSRPAQPLSQPSPPRVLSVRERCVVGGVAGSLAGAATTALLHPLDSLKTTLQLRHSTHRGPLLLLRALTSARRVRLLWRGVVPATLGSAASSFLFFGSFELANAFGAPPVVGAALGNAVSSLVLVPKEAVKARLQAGFAGGAVAQIRALVTERGVAGGLYAAWLPTFLRNAPSNVVSLGAYKALQAAQLRVSRRDHLRPAESLATGAAAGALAALATQPLDLVKTRLMTQQRGALAKPGVELYTGLMSTLRTVVREEGVRGLAKGLSTRLLFNALFSSVGLTAFEAAKRRLVARLLRERPQTAVAARC